MAEGLMSLRGDPFSDPSEITIMPDEWINRPVEYSSEHAGADLVLTLNQQFFHFIEPLIEEYANNNNLKIVINKGTCGISAAMISNKQGDMGSFCCPPSKTDRLPGIRFHTIGIHPVSILVHPDNPLDNITLKQARDVFQGNISRWARLGWNDRPIRIIGRLHCKKRPGHWRLLLDNENLFAPELRSVGSIEDMFSLVSSDPNAIGYEVMWMSKISDDEVKALKINGNAPDDLRTLLKGNYPIYRALYLTTWEPENVKNRHAHPLVKYIESRIDIIGMDKGIVPASMLRKAGWKFRGSELIGEPEQK